MNKLPKIVYLIIGIPLSSLVVGVVMLVAATSNTTPELNTSAKPLNKTSWQQLQDQPADRPLSDDQRSEQMEEMRP